MSKKKDRERAERGQLFREGKLVSKEDASRLTQGRHELSELRRNPMVGLGMIARRRLGRSSQLGMIPVEAAAAMQRCIECDNQAVALIDDVPYCEEHLKQLVSKEAENGKEDTAPHNADAGGGDECGEASGEGGTPSGGEEAGEPDAA